MSTDATQTITTSPGGAQPREHVPVLIVGAGPAGLTSAYELLRRDHSFHPLVLEADDQVGGIARTEEYKGYRFDIGGHRFFTKVTEVEQLWKEVLGDEFITVPRLSRIYYQGKFYNYPLQLRNTLENLGFYESTRILLSYLKWKVKPSREEINLEQWVCNRFGGRLFRHFFRTYTEKVWGIPCTEIRADWAAQRIKNLSLRKAVMGSLTGKHNTSTLINSFQYPRLGPGQMWETFTDEVQQRGGEVRLQNRVTHLVRDGQKFVEANVETAAGEHYTVAAKHFISSMPLSALIHSISPPPPQPIVDAASSLKYRDFLIVTLILDHPDPFEDNWIYIHSPEVSVGRIQNFRSWSSDMVPSDNHASIGMEYFCHQGDGLWDSSNEDLIELASNELDSLGLAPKSSVVDGTVIRQTKAYPVYDAEYKEHLDVIYHWLTTLDNLQTIGRNGMHRYNNQDHSMLTALLAARNVLGESHDIWNVNVERSYHEDVVVRDKEKSKR